MGHAHIIFEGVAGGLALAIATDERKKSNGHLGRWEAVGVELASPSGGEGR